MLKIYNLYYLLINFEEFMENTENYLQRTAILLLFTQSYE
jgi:hypothetical protein